MFNLFKKKRPTTQAGFDAAYWNDKYPKAPIIYNGRTLKTNNTPIKIDVKNYICANDNVLLDVLRRNRLIKGSFNETAVAVQKWVTKNIKYVADDASNKCPEFWQFPFETLAGGVGDCEDGGILIASLLVNAGIPEWRVKIAAGYVQEAPTAPQGGHAYCIYLADRPDSEKGFEWVILDWCIADNKRTTISTPNGKKRISKLNVGDWIIGYDEEKNTPSLTQIKSIGNRIANNVFKISFEHGDPVYATGEHPFLVGGKWVRTDELKIGDEPYWVKPQTLFSQFHNHKSDPWRESAAMKISQKNRENGLYERLSERMKTNNPFTWTSVREKLSKNNAMKRPEVVEKVVASRLSGEMSGPEINFVKYCKKNNLPVEFVGDGKFWIRTTKGSKNPDFRIPGTKKLIEVSDKGFEYYRNWEQYKQERKQIFEEKGFQVEFVLFNHNKICEPTDMSVVHNYIMNGNKITSIEPASKKEWTVWNMHCEPHNNYFVNGNLVHNCYFEDSTVPCDKKPLAKNGGYNSCYKDTWFTFNNQYSWNQTKLEIDGRVK